MSSKMRKVGFVLAISAVTVFAAYGLGSFAGGYMAQSKAIKERLAQRAADTKQRLTDMQTLEIDMTMPDHVFTTVDGDTVKLYDLLQKKTVITFISATCPNCLDEINILSRLAKSREASAAFIFISGSDPKALRLVRDSYGLLSPVLCDREDVYGLKFFDFFVFPFTIIVDKDAKIEDIMVDGLMDDEMTDIIKANKI